MNTVPRRVEKRNRPPLSCEPCRNRKLKCNRAFPCDSCIRRNLTSSCRYAASARPSDASVDKKRSLTDRLKNLEALVSSLAAEDVIVQPRKGSDGDAAADHLTGTAMRSKQSNFTPSPGSNEGGQIPGKAEEGLEPETPRIRQTHDGQVNYVDSTHWLSVLEDIREVREHLSPSGHFLLQDHPSKQEPDPQVRSVLGLSINSNLDEILASLPPRPVCDWLLSHYFNDKFLCLGFIHPFKFQGEYERFWVAPSKAPTLWIALLFGVLSVAATHLQAAKGAVAAGTDDGPLPNVRILQQGTAECLIAGKFASANAYALEALLLHIQSCFLTKSSNDHTDLWFEMGTVIRLAFRMGYHRDPSKVPSISPFDGEMRRRVWVNIFQWDAHFSFQMGIPSMIPTEDCDTQPPRNLEYSDLRVDMETLPPSRPFSDDTPVIYIIAKTHVMQVFKKIVTHTQSLASPTYDKTISLDLEARDAYNKIPEQLKQRDVSRSFMDPSSRIFERACIEITYLRSLVILHRRYVSYHEPANPRFDASRHACVEAALDIIHRQADLHRASQPGGRLWEDRWMNGALTVHDFLLAAMVLGLYLSVHLRCDDHNPTGFGPAPPATTGAADHRNQALANRAYHALQTSLQVWRANSPLCTEAYTASLALELMLRKVSEKKEKKNNAAGTANNWEKPPLTTTTTTTTTTIITHQHQPSQSIDMSVPSVLPYADLVADTFDGIDTPDWNLLDRYFRNPNTDASAGQYAEIWNDDPGFPYHYPNLSDGV